MNNLAEILTIKLDNYNILVAEWNKQLSKLNEDNLLLYHVRNYSKPPNLNLKLENFTEYFQNLFFKLKDELQLELTDYRIFYHDYYLYKTKLETSIVHKDVNRMSAITIPIYASDPILFYDDTEPYNPNIRKKLIKKPNQIHVYKHDYPTLINTNSLHSVFLLDEKTPRAIVQVNLYESFDDVIQRNKDKCRLI